MRNTFAIALLLCANAAGLGQQSKTHEQGPDREIIGPKGNRIHHFLSPQADVKFRSRIANAQPLGFACPPTVPSGGGCTSTPMVYGTGPVMRNPTNYLIFWQPAGAPTTFPAGYQLGIEKYFQNIGGTPYYNIVTQYNDTSGVSVPNATSLGAPSYTDTTTAAPSGCVGTASGAVGATPKCPLTDADIQAEVNVALAANPQWARPGTNVEYFVYTPDNVGECSGTGSDGNAQCFAITGGVGTGEDSSFCAYHSYFNGTAPPTIYAYMPFASDANCYGPAGIPFPNGAVLDVVISPTSHEMIETNTDPLINAWKGAGGNADEIGDKCSYIYGYIAPDGTSVVLKGNRFQIQEEYSNDSGNCTKRYGPDPVVAIPGAITFGEVQAGTSSQMASTIQNNGGGDLNILGFHLGTESDGNTYYSLVNGQPTAATLPSGESLTANMLFAPLSGALFGSPTDALIVDTDQTPCAVNSTCTTPSNTAFANITGTVGVSPDALCSAANVFTDLNLCTNASASINGGSIDPDGEGVTVTQSPAGPYTLGATSVTLTAVDNGPDHAVAHCAANVTVTDNQKPNIACPAATSVSCTSSAGAAVGITPTVFDNCPAVTSSCVPASGSGFGFGSTPVLCTAKDASGNTNTCSTSVTVNDIAPTISSVVAAPAVLSPPNKKLDPVNILVKATDACDPTPSCSITSVARSPGPISSSDYRITGPLSLLLKANGNGGHAMSYIVTVTCSGLHGGTATAQTTVSAP